MTTRVALAWTASIGLALLSLGWAQEKHAIAFESLPGASEYTQDYRIEVGDIPGHIVRVFEIQWDTSKFEPVPTFNGVAVVSAVTSGLTDYQDFNGVGEGYMTFTLETGDKIFIKHAGATQTAYTDEGDPESSTYAGLLTITGGTGEFTGIRGMMRQVSVWNLATDQSKVTPTTFEGEYWMVGPSTGGM